MTTHFLFLSYDRNKTPMEAKVFAAIERAESFGNTMIENGQIGFFVVRRFPPLGRIR